MDQSVEGVSKQCRFWKSQLEALMEQNRHLRLEERSLRHDYEEMLRKTRNNNDILHHLQDSEKELVAEIADYCALGKRSETSYFENLDLSSHCLLLESDKKQLVQNLKVNNDRLAKINAHLNLNSAEEKDVQITTSKEISEMEKKEVEPPMDGEDPDECEKSGEAQSPGPEEDFFASTSIRTKTLFEASRKENAHLRHIYSVLNDRMQRLNELYLENNERCSVKGSELQAVSEKASDLFRLVLQKRKNFAIPQRKLTDELTIKIQNQVKKVDALRSLMILVLAFGSEDSNLYGTFTNDVRDIYRSALLIASSNDQSYSEVTETRPENCNGQTL